MSLLTGATRNPNKNVPAINPETIAAQGQHVPQRRDDRGQLENTTMYELSHGNNPDGYQYLAIHTGRVYGGALRTTARLWTVRPDGGRTWTSGDYFRHIATLKVTRVTAKLTQAQHDAACEDAARHIAAAAVLHGYNLTAAGVA